MYRAVLPQVFVVQKFIMSRGMAGMIFCKKIVFLWSPPVR